MTRGTYWPSDDIARRDIGPETIPVERFPAEAATEIGHADDHNDGGVEMLGRLLLWAVALVICAAVIALVLTR
jgi:hypothetical protein